MRPARCLGVGLALAFLAPLAPVAQAGNTVHPRTPVLWPDAPCIQTVDLDVAPSFAFDYEIPAEDTQLSADEFDDSRTHQFVGFCRQWPAGRPPPRYISLADLQRAVDSGFETPDKLGDPESTLESSAAWAGCWTRITADDMRRAITWDAAAEPVQWDLAAVEPGTWLIAGYTWEPPYNLWSRAPWVLRVIDGASADTPQAAVAIADTSDTLYADETLELPVCVDAEPGSTLTLAWAPTKPEVLEWTALDTVAVEGADELVLSFSPPPESLGLLLVLRATLEQPSGAPYAGHALDPLIVFDPSGGDGDGDPETGDSGDATATGGETDGDTGGAEPPASGGHCSLAPAPDRLPAFTLALWLLAPALRRRRRRSTPLD